MGGNAYGPRRVEPKPIKRWSIQALRLMIDNPVVFGSMVAGLTLASWGVGWLIPDVKVSTIRAITVPVILALFSIFPLLLIIVRSVYHKQPIWAALHSTPVPWRTLVSSCWMLLPAIMVLLLFSLSSEGVYVHPVSGAEAAMSGMILIFFGHFYLIFPIVLFGPGLDASEARMLINHALAMNKELFAGLVLLVIVPFCLLAALEVAALDAAFTVFLGVVTYLAYADLFDDRPPRVEQEHRGQDFQAQTGEG